jgi:hypothetical protein
LGESPKEEPEVAESEEQVEEPGFLDMLAEAEEAVQLLARAMEEITSSLRGCLSTQTRRCGRWLSRTHGVGVPEDDCESPKNSRGV